MEFDLVFEGGGAKGLAFIGALQEFESRGHKARRYVGTSAGAITAALMACGYQANEMLASLTEQVNGKPRFSTFMDIAEDFSPNDVENSLTYDVFRAVDLPWIPKMAENFIDDKIMIGLMKLPVYRQMFSFIERGGLYAGDAFVSWIQAQFDAKNPGLGKATFATFKQQTGADLTLIASDTERHQMLILNHRTAPDCPVAWAVRMSMSIPFMWQEVRWQPGWGNYRSQDITGSTIVDGGVLSNFPIELITSSDEDVIATMGNIDPKAAPNLGLLIDEKLAVANAPQTEQVSSNMLLNGVKHLRTMQRITKLVDTMTDAHDNLAIREHEAEICRVPAQGYGTTEFDMSAARLNALISAGRDAMKNHLLQRGL